MPSVWTAEKGYDTVVIKLRGKGTSVNSKGEYGQIPLTMAASNGREAIVKLLLEKDADVKAKDKKGRAPLMWAAMEGQKVAVKLLLEQDMATLPVIWSRLRQFFAGGGYIPSGFN